MNNKGITGEITEVRSCTGLLCLEWKIPRFFNLSDLHKDYDKSPSFFNLSDLHKDYYNSPSFIFRDVCWHLRVYPNCFSSGYVAISLESENPVNSTDAAVRVAVEIKGSAGVEKKTENELNLGYCFSWPAFPVWNCFRKELSEQKDRLMPDGVLTIVCEIKIPQSAEDPPAQNEEVKVFSEEIESSEKEGMEELQNSLRNLLKGGEDCDVTLKARDKEFRAHRSIMRARSPVFHAMFGHDMLEKQKGVVTMDDIDPETFPDFLEHVYMGSVRMISADNVTSLFVASDKYYLKTLRRECARFMGKNMNVASFCDVISVAVRHNEEELLQLATEFFCNNSLDIIKTVEWQIFLKENTTVGNELLIKLLSK